MFTEEQIKAIIQENERLRKENDALSGKVASLEQSLYWLRKKMFGRMSEKNLPLDPNQLSLFTQQEMSPDEKAGLEEEARKAEEEMTRTIKVTKKVLHHSAFFLGELIRLGRLIAPCDMLKTRLLNPMLVKISCSHAYKNCFTFTSPRYTQDRACCVCIA